jgi:Icc-related predicted phosphoesterase
MNFLAVSDVHNKQIELDLDLDGIDVLLNAGDGSGHKAPVVNFNELASHFEWMASLDVKHKIYIPGNHDTSFEAKMFSPEMIKDYGITILNHESLELDGINIFGSPYTPSFDKGWAYNVERGRLHNYWEVIPDITDILVTHGPPKGILDKALNYGFYSEVGDLALLKRVKKLNVKYHIFGHIHEDYGKTLKVHDSDTTFINASVLDETYRMKNANGIRFTYTK